MKRERMARIDHELQRELARLISTELKDPRLGFVTVTRVEMTDDLRSAQVFFRLLDEGDVPEKRSEALTGLARASGLLRREVSRRAGLRYAPELRFAYDEGQDERTRIEMLLEEVRAEERARGRS